MNGKFTQPQHQQNEYQKQDECHLVRKGESWLDKAWYNIMNRQTNTTTTSHQFKAFLCSTLFSRSVQDNNQIKYTVIYPFPIFGTPCYFPHLCVFPLSLLFFLSCSLSDVIPAF